MVKRFISSDTLISTGQGLLSYNMFAYCNNNPVMYVDPSGHAPKWLEILARILFTPVVCGYLTQGIISTVSYVGISVASIFDSTIKEDMDEIGWNPFNDDESETISSQKVSFYKGVPIFKTNKLNGSLSLGVICLNENADIDILKHERGHSTQFMNMGLINYLIQIGIPSIWKNDDNTPWELSASMLGGSNLSNISTFSERNAANYYYDRARIPIADIVNIVIYIFDY